MISLSECTDNELIGKVKTGDGSAFSVLTGRYLPMLVSCSKKYFDISSTQYDEAFSEACGAFHRAVVHYDENENVTFGLYAKIAVNREVARFFRENNKHEQYIRSETDVADISVPSPVEHKLIVDEEMKEILSRVKANASEFEYQVFEEWFLDGKSVSDIASDMARDVRSITNAKNRLIRRLRENPQILHP